MAKLGMPSVIISFKEAGIAAIERSQRGIVFLILEEEQEVIDKLTVNTSAICGKAITGQAITGNIEKQEIIENPLIFLANLVRIIRIILLSACLDM